MKHCRTPRNIFWLALLFLCSPGLANAAVITFSEAYVFNRIDPPSTRHDRSVFVTVKNHTAQTRYFEIYTVVRQYPRASTSRRFRIRPYETKSAVTHLRYDWRRHNGRTFTIDIYLREAGSYDTQDKWSVSYRNLVGRASRSVPIRSTRSAAPRPRPRVTVRRPRPAPVTTRRSLDLSLDPNIQIGKTTHRVHRGVFRRTRRARFTPGHIIVQRSGRSHHMLALTTRIRIVNKGTRSWNGSAFLSSSIQAGTPGSGLRRACTGRGGRCPNGAKTIRVRLRPGQGAMYSNNISSLAGGYIHVRPYRWYTLTVKVTSRADQNHNNNQVMFAFKFDRNGRIIAQRHVNPDGR